MLDSVLLMFQRDSVPGLHLPLSNSFISFLGLSQLIHWQMIKCSHICTPQGMQIREATVILQMLYMSCACEYLMGVIPLAPLIQGLQSTVDANGGAAAQRLGVEVMTALVGEFSLSSATPLGMAWELHESCCRDMEVRGSVCHKVLRCVC